MVGYHGGQTVKAGLYLKRSTWELESIARGGGVLSGNKETYFRRLPLPAVMVVGPLMGLAYVISLPILFCLVFGYFLARLVGRKLKVTKYSKLGDEVP
ncbi:MAG: hypothetical protein V3V23_02640 [Dehalococcoidales bacterium]